MKAIWIQIGIGTLGFLSAFPVQSAEKVEGRTWTDLQGRTLEAELIGLGRGQRKVIFKVANGNEFTFPLDQLIAADQALVRLTFPSDAATATKQIDQLIFKRLDHVPNTPATDNDKHSNYLANLRALAKPSEPLSDERFLQRIYPSLTGRDPSPEEVSAFQTNTDPNKREALIDRLVESEEFVNHFLGFLDDLLRVDGARLKAVAYPECLSKIGKEQIAEIRRDQFSPPPPESYRDWVKTQIQGDRPWNQLVKEILTASGKYSENPATGYLLAEHGIGLINPSHAMTAFAGVEITCAQCHDHPYEEIYQMDYLRIAAFFGELQIQPVDGKLLSADANLVDEPTNRARLPSDYRYNDGTPGDPVSPGVYFGATVDREKSPTARAAFADWLTAESNPRFTYNIVNRLWEHLYGTALVEPACNLPGHLGDVAHDLELLEYLAALMKEKDYRLKAFLKLLCKTEAFSGTKG